MNYTQRIGGITDVNMATIINNCLAHIPDGYQSHPYSYPELNHGVDLLQSEDALDCYMGAYGEMHHSKCRGALQNIPYPPKNATTLSVEIIDWGCGQGIGAVSVIDFLKERDLTMWLKKVTLIEPSAPALTRAEINVTRATENRVRVMAINACLPCNGDDREITGICFETRHVIHIFSNILDVEGIDLRKIALCMAVPGHTHYICCIGPLNANAFRMERFFEMFHPDPQQVFSSISDRSYGRTSNTNYTYTCKTKGFVYEGTPLDFSAYSPEEKATEPVYGEYDVNLLIGSGTMSNSKGWVYYRLQSILAPTDLIYIDPDINGCSPDFIIIRPNVGLMIISVFEIPLSNCSLDTSDNKLKYEVDGISKTFQNPCSVLEMYQSRIVESSAALTKAVIKSKQNLGLVRRVLICPGGSTAQADALFGKNQYVSVYGNEFIRADEVYLNFFRMGMKTKRARIL